MNSGRIRELLEFHKRTIYILTGILTGHCLIGSFAGMSQDYSISYNDVQEIAGIGKTLFMWFLADKTFEDLWAWWQMFH